MLVQLQQNQLTSNNIDQRTFTFNMRWIYCTFLHWLVIKIFTVYSNQWLIVENKSAIVYQKSLQLITGWMTPVDNDASIGPSFVGRHWISSIISLGRNYLVSSWRRCWKLTTHANRNLFLWLWLEPFDTTLIANFFFLKKNGGKSKRW